jgi:hypothetical protein
MDDIEELHNFFNKRGFREDNLKKIAIYIEKYADILFSHYNIQIEKNELEVVSVKLYKTLLHQARTQSMQIDQSAEQILLDVLNDFDSNTEEAMGDMIAIIGKAGTIEDTRHPKITHLGQKIAVDQNPYS